LKLVIFLAVCTIATGAAILSMPFEENHFAAFCISQRRQTQLAIVFLTAIAF